MIKLKMYTEADLTELIFGDKVYIHDKNKDIILNKKSTEHLQHR